MFHVRVTSDNDRFLYSLAKSRPSIKLVFSLVLSYITYMNIGRIYIVILYVLLTYEL